MVPEEVAIVGVAADVRYADLTRSAEPIAYVPITQIPARRQSLVLRGSGEAFSASVKQALRDVDPDVTVELGTMAALVDASLGGSGPACW